MTKEKITLQLLSQITDQLASFIEEKGLESEFVLWSAENKTKEFVEIVGALHGADIGRAIGNLIEQMKHLDKDVKNWPEETTGR